MRQNWVIALAATVGIAAFVVDARMTPDRGLEPVREAAAAELTERDIREMQEMLADMGFAPGPVDGVFSLRTQAALVRFQQEQGIAPTGELDAATRQALVMAWAGRGRPPSTAGRRADFAVFTDTLVDGSACGFCPELVVIPAGTFTMGSPLDEDGRDDSEGPQHEVRVPRFALGRHEVTFAQYDACVEAGGCAERPDDEGWGRGDRPVIDVSWDDAEAYVAWLSETTGEAYRLPSEAEWEYAARAGTTTPFSTGATISTSQANYDGYYNNTMPVGSFDANPWDLFDMHGNVWEWVEDCLHVDYYGAPVDGSAWLEADGGNCLMRGLRGGSWYDNPRSLRSANRTFFDSDTPYWSSGFRVARTFTP